MAPVIFTVTQSQRGERTAAGSQYPAHRHGHPPPLPFHPQVSLISRIKLIREPVKKSVENFTLGGVQTGSFSTLLPVVRQVPLANGKEK